MKPFTTLGDLNTSVLDDDYTHSTLTTIKVKGSTSAGSKFDSKIKLNLKNGDLSIKDEGKV